MIIVLIKWPKARLIFHEPNGFALYVTCCSSTWSSVGLSPAVCEREHSISINGISGRLLSIGHSSASMHLMWEVPRWFYKRYA